MNRLLSGKVVNIDAWVDQNYDYLWHIYRIVQEMNDSSGRRVFDKCTFNHWCELAYKHSSLYTRNEEWMYEEEEEEEESPYQGTDN
jgi:hypothetical protein